MGGVFIQPDVEIVLYLIKGLPCCYRKHLTKSISTSRCHTVTLTIGAINILRILSGTERRANTDILVRVRILLDNCVIWTPVIVDFTVCVIGAGGLLAQDTGTLNTGVVGSQIFALLAG
jgi:hypothetical protein